MALTLVGLTGCEDEVAATPGELATAGDFGLRDRNMPSPWDAEPPATPRADASPTPSPVDAELGPEEEDAVIAQPDAAVTPADQFVAPEVADDEEGGSAARCFEDISSPDVAAPDYDQFDPVVGDHCSGTNHQDIRGVEQVVFLGDSVTNGTPDDAHPLCLDNDHLFRTQLANWLADRYALSKGNPLEWEQWESYSCLYDGDPGLVRSGDFANCARWGANNEDLLRYVDTRNQPDETREAFCGDCCAGGVCGDGRRCIRAAGTPATDERCGFERSTIRQCVPDSVTQERTLFVFTMGGNDVANMTKAGGEFTMDTPEGRAEIEADYPSVREMSREALTHLEEAIRYMTDPARFPNGSYVVVGGPFEFTDGTGQVDSCQPQSISIPFVGDLDLSALALDVAGLVGFQRWANPAAQRAIISEFLEGYMRIVVEYGADYVWVLEHFCGHGYVAAGGDPDLNNPCYRPEDPTLWFDASCTHPNDAGHSALFRLFRDVIAE